MKHKWTQIRKKRRVVKFLLCVLCVLSWLVPGARADDVGDISADASAIYTGNTFHGYAEIRVDLQNRSHDRAHAVTLVYPNSSYGSGNSIGRESRTVTLAPESLETVSLLQPPLPAQGDESIRVEVDDGHQGEIHAPNANNHCNDYSSDVAATVFISRSLDDEAVERLFQGNPGGYSASQATGPPDVPARGAVPTTVWMPDTRRPGETNWLELNYASPQPVNKIDVYMTIAQTFSGSITLIGSGGTNIATISMSSGSPKYYGSEWVSEFDFTTTTAAVKTVHLNFGKVQSYRIAIDAVQISGPTGNQWASDARASSDNSAAASGYGGGYGGTPDQEAFENMRSESPVTDWSEHWLAYSPFDAVVLGDADLSSMSPGVFDAIGNYLYAGGNVVLFSATDLPGAWHPWAKHHVQDGVLYQIGFGRCYVFRADNPGSLRRKSTQALRAAARESASYWQSLPDDEGSAESALPIHANLKVPARGIVLAMLAFVIVIGPANLIILHRSRRRVWMLWTVPAISLATTLTIFTYSLLREGITPDVRISGLTLLDQTTHHAATFGGTAFYCPLTPGGGLSFDYETEATPLVHNTAEFGGGVARDVDWTQSQHFQRGWVSARDPAYFHLRKSETSRERIEVSDENGSLQIVNGLGADIKSLWLADGNMKFYEANNVPAGKKMILNPSKPSLLLLPLAESGPDKLKADLGFAGNVPDDFSSRAQSYLLPNTYIAVLDGNPFIENALTSTPNPKHTKTLAIVFGILDSSK